MADDLPKPQRRFWRGVRRVLRWCRITVWFVLLALIILALWLNRFGLPEFARERLVSELRTHGVELRFSRIRLVWFRGLVADHIEFGRAGGTNGLRAAAAEAEVHLRVRPLLRREIDVEGVALRGGRVVVPVWGTNDTPRELAIEKVSGELHFLPGDEWELSGFQAEAFGVQLRLRGTVTNATAIRGWKFGRTKPKEKTPEAFWHDLVRQFERTKFEAPSQIVGTITGDARHLDTFRVNVNLSAPAIEAPWGQGKKLTVSAQIRPQAGALIYAEVKLQAQETETPWGRAQSVDLEAKLAPSLTQWTPTNAHLDLRVKQARTAWGGASALTLQADFRPNPSDAGSALADYSLRGQQLQTKWARFAQAELSAAGVVSVSNAWPSAAKTKLSFVGGGIDAGRAASGHVEATLALPPWELMGLADTNVSWWTRLEKISGDVTAQLTDVHAPRIDVTNVTLAATWQPPLLTVRRLFAELYDGELNGSASLDTSTRRLTAEMKSDFDPQQISQLLATSAQQWLAQFNWDEPPELTATVRATLPPWTNAPAWMSEDWWHEVRPTLALTGGFDAGHIAFHSLPVQAARSDFAYSNHVWRLPNLLLTRHDGPVRIAHVTHDDTGEFEFVIDSATDPRVVRPLFDADMQRIIDDFTLTQPPIIHAEIAGRWNALAQLTARAQFAVTNGGYRGRAVQSCRTLITFTNQVLGLIAPEVVRAEGSGRADSVIIDVPKLKLYINNATGALAVADVTHVIGAAVEKTMAPYHFLGAPPALANGMVDLNNGLGSDLRFSILGGGFEWRSFRFQQITGDVHWAGTALLLSNIVGTMHGGSMELSAAFDFTAKQGVDFAFHTQARDLNFHALMNDFYSPTNKLEGTLSGLLEVTKANTDRPQSWFGYGHTTLQDGLIWDVPALGLFSPLLNKLKPGSGNSRAREVAATFIITNSVILTDDLLIHASGMRLNFDGTVDFDTRVNGRMEAEVLRDMPFLGPIVATVLTPVSKLFEYKVGGTLGQPKSEPLFIPKIFMLPFHPIRTLRELVEPDKAEPPLVK